MMLSDAQGYLQTAPWYALFPGTCDRMGGAWIFTAGRRYPEMGREQGRVEAVW